MSFAFHVYWHRVYVVNCSTRVELLVKRNFEQYGFSFCYKWLTIWYPNILIINPHRACAARVTVVGLISLCVCVSVKSHLTYGVSVRPENAVTYSAGNEGQIICGDLPETTTYNTLHHNYCGRDVYMYCWMWSMVWVLWLPFECRHYKAGHVRHH